MEQLVVDEQVHSRNPFPGLRPYESTDCDYFFGREEQIYEVLNRLRNQRFLAVIGNSGSGKSSLVRAGVLPALQQGFMSEHPDSWRIRVFRPGASPLANLAKALVAPDVVQPANDRIEVEASLLRAELRRDAQGIVNAFRHSDLPEGSKLLLVVDQFEELFRFIVDRGETSALDEAHLFVKRLLAASAQREVPIYVILTMRSEFLGYCTPFSHLPETINEGLYLIPQMRREQLREAIQEPIRLSKGEITPRLVNRLLNDLGEQQDQLPVLQHALMRLWSLAPQKSLDIGLYESPAIGGLSHCLSRHVEEILSGLSDSQRALSVIVFRNLTQVSENGSLIRHPTKLCEICSAANVHNLADVSEVIEKFRGEGQPFLTPPASDLLTSESIIDISHESLIRQWDKLKEWTLEEHRWRRIRQSLRDDAEKWNLNGRNSLRESDYLLTGTRLAEALDWQAANQGQIVRRSMTVAREFLKRSIDHDAYQRNQEQHAQDLKKTNHRLLWGSICLTILVVCTVFAWGTARYSQSQAEKDTRSAIAAQKAADIKAAIARTDTAEAQQDKRGALAVLRAADSRNTPTNLPVSRLLLAVESLRTTLDPRNGQVAVPPAVRQALDDAIRWFEPAGMTSRVLGSHDGAVRCLGLSADDRWLVTGGDDGIVKLWDLDAPQKKQIALSGFGGAITAVKLSKDAESRTLVVGTAAGAVFVHKKNEAGEWDPEGLLIGRLRDRVTDIEFSRDSRWIVTGSHDSNVRAWRSDELAKPFELTGHSGVVQDIVAFEVSKQIDPAAQTVHPNPQKPEQWVATGDSEGLILMWKLAESDPNQSKVRLESFGYGLQDIVVPEQSPALTPSEASTEAPAAEPSTISLAAVFSTGQIASWELSPLVSGPKIDLLKQSWSSRGENDNFPNRVAFNSVSFLDQTSNTMVAGGEVGLMLFTPAPNFTPPAAAAFSDATLKTRLTVEPVKSVRVGARDGASGCRWMAAIQDSGAIQLHRTQGGYAVRQPLILRGHDGEITEASFRRKVAHEFITVGTDGLVRVWNCQGENTQAISAFSLIETSCLSADGRWVAVADNNGKIRVSKVNCKLDQPGSAPTHIDFHLSELVSAEASSTAPQSSTPQNANRQDRIVGQSKVRLLFSGQQVDRVQQELQLIVAFDGRIAIKRLDPSGQAQLRLVYAVTKSQAPASEQQQSPREIDQNQPEVLTALEASPDGRWLAGGLNNGTLCVWDLSKPNFDLTRLHGHNREISCLSFSADGQRLVSCGRDKCLRSWKLNLASEKFERLIASGKGPEIPDLRLGDSIARATLVDEGRRALLVSDSGEISVWTIVDQGSPQKLWSSEQDREHQSSQSGLFDSRRADQEVQLSENGSWLVIGKRGPSALLYDLADTAKSPISFELTGHEQGTAGCRFSPDSHRLLTSGTDGSLRVWSLDEVRNRRSKQLPCEPVAHYWSNPVGIVDAIFANDGMVYTLDADAVVRTWSTSPVRQLEKWTDVSRTYSPIIGRNPTVRESRSFHTESEPANAFKSPMFPEWDRTADRETISAHKQHAAIELIEETRKLVLGGNLPESIEVQNKLNLLRKLRPDAQHQEIFSRLADDLNQELIGLQAKAVLRTARQLLAEGDEQQGLESLRFALDKFKLDSFDSDQIRQTLRELAYRNAQEDDFAVADEFWRLASKLGNSSTTFDAKQVACDHHLEQARLRALGGDFVSAAGEVRKCQELGFGLEVSADEYVRLDYALKQLRDATWNLSSNDDKSVVELLRKAQSAFPALRISAEELAEKMIKRRDERKKLQSFLVALRTIEEAQNAVPDGKGKIPFPDWAHFPDSTMGVKFSLGPTTIQGRTYRGQITEALQQLHETQVAGFAAAIEPVVLNDLAYLGCLAGRAVDLRDVANSAVENDPANPSFRDTRGLVHALNGEKEAAIADFRVYVLAKAFSREGAQGKLRLEWIKKLEAGEAPSKFLGSETMLTLKKVVRSQIERIAIPSLLDYSFWKDLN